MANVGAQDSHSHYSKYLFDQFKDEIGDCFALYRSLFADDAFGKLPVHCVVDTGLWAFIDGFDHWGIFPYFHHYPF